MKFPIFFYLILWTPLAILNIISVILPFSFLEFQEECKFPERGLISFSGFQRAFIGIFIIQIAHFSFRKLKGLNLLPKLDEDDYNLAIILQVLNICFSFAFFHLISKSNCEVIEIKIQGFLRIISVLGSPILVYGLYEEPTYNVIIAQPVDEEIEIELPIYNNSVSDQQEENYSDIDV